MTLQQAFDFSRPAPPPNVRTNLVIEAGAGTGKTTAIVAEVLKLMLEREDLQPERIVLMTFTEKAAGEIADRIRVALEELAAENGERLAWPIGSPHPLVDVPATSQTRSALARHLANIDALRSQTIHSFCQSILRTFPIEAGLDPQFKIIEGFERSLLYGQLYDAWLDAETRTQPTEEGVREWELLFTHVGYLFQIRIVVLALMERRDLFDESAYDFGRFEEVSDALKEAIHAIRSCPDDVGDDNARRVFSYIRTTDPPPDDIESWIAFLQPIAANIHEANLPRHGVLKEALRNLRAGDKGNSIHERLVSHRAAMALIALTRRFVAFLDAEKRKLGVVDFDDLLLRTAAVLEDPEVLARARSQIDSIFVDEFQDTDRTQARIIERLARDASGAFVPGKTIVVGDPKQSIYGFRRADPETYYRLTEELVNGGARRVPLLEQYRSDAPLVDVVNSMFMRLFPLEIAHDPNVFRPAYRELHAARPTLRRELDSRVTMLLAEHEEKNERHRAEARVAADWILANRDGSALDLQRFAVLFRRLTKLDDYLDVFDQCGIDYVLPPTRLFLEKRAPVDLVAVLRAIAWPFDTGAQISAARTPYFALTDVEIAQGKLELERHQDGAEATGPSPAGTPWHEFTSRIAAFREESFARSISSLIDLILQTTDIEAVYGATTDGTRHLRHLEHLRSIAFEYEQRQRGSLRQFVDEIARRRDDPEEAEPSLVDESKNAVRILSVHAAKGLEFDTVILPDLAFPTTSSEAMQLFTVESPRSLVLCGRADSISANFRHTEDDEKLKKISSRREEAEMRRLFYVAVTRAKTDVVFVCSLGDDTRNTGFMKCLYEALGEDRNSLRALWPDDGRQIRATAVGPVAFERPVRDAPATAAQQRARLRDRDLETQLRGGDIVPAALPPIESDLETLTQAEIAARRAGSRNRATGTLLHRVLELWDGRSDLEPLLARLAAEDGVETEGVARVRRRLATVARSPVALRILQGETLGREVPVRFVESGNLVERRIDRLLRETENDLVVDYKSGKAETSRIAKDRLQVERYCEAVRNITGRPCRGALWYIDLDADELIEVG